jgi:hypothetical protein
VVPVKDEPPTTAPDESLRIERAGPNGLAFTLDGLSNVTHWPWIDVVTAMLEFAFLERPVCLTTPDAEAARWELDFREMYTDVELRRVQKYPYLCAFDPCVSAEVLAAIARSNDFYLGPIWFATLPRDDTQRWVDLMEAMFDTKAFSTWPRTGEEFFYSDQDGDWMTWMNPARPEATIVDELRRLAQANGWGVVSNLS